MKVWTVGCAQDVYTDYVPNIECSTFTCLCAEDSRGLGKVDNSLSLHMSCDGHMGMQEERVGDDLGVHC